MRILWLAGISYAVFTAQASCASELAIAGLVPHLVWVALLVIASRLDFPTVGIIAGAWGLWTDLLGDNRLGYHLVSFVLAAECVRRAAAQRWLETPARLAVAALPLIGLAVAGKHYGDGLSAGHSVSAAAIGLAAAGTAIYSAALIFFISTVWQFLAGQPIDTGSTGPIVSNHWRRLTG